MDLVQTTSLACVHEKLGWIFLLQLQQKFDQIHIRQNGTLSGRDLRHEVVPCNHCNCSQFRSARFESVKRHFGMLRAFLMLWEQ